jgi:hypothetical protein
MNLHFTYKESEQKTLKLKLQTHIGENHIRRSFMICASHSSGDLVVEEVGWACSTHGGEQKCIQGFGWDVGRKGRE